MSSKGCVLVTGGAGYIGSHTSIEVLNAGFDVVIIDNFVNASEGTLFTLTYLLKLTKIQLQIFHCILHSCHIVFSC